MRYRALAKAAETRRKQALFIELLKRGYSPTKAAKHEEVKYDLNSFYALAREDSEEGRAFDREWDEAIEQRKRHIKLLRTPDLDDKVFEQAIEGDYPSQKLYLEAHHEAYRKKPIEIGGEGGGPIVIHVKYEGEAEDGK